MQKQGEITGLFAIGVVSDILRRGVSDIRWGESHGYYKYQNGKDIIPKRMSVQDHHPGYRRYSAQDIIDMAESLVRQNRMTQAEYERVLIRVAGLRD